jgi:hypothetical protein
MCSHVGCQPFEVIRRIAERHAAIALPVFVSRIPHVTTTRTGLRVKAALDTRLYETAVHVPDEVLALLRITPRTEPGVLILRDRLSGLASNDEIDLAVQDLEQRDELID